MSKLVYWHKYDEPKKWVDEVTGKECESTGEWKCDHPLVERGWFTASINPKDEKTCINHLHLMTKDNQRGMFRVNNFEDTEEAEKWLQSIQ